MAFTTIHQFLFISIVSVNMQRGTSHHVPFFKPEKPCWFLISLGFVYFKLVQGRFAEGACSFSSQSCCSSVIQLQTGGLPTAQLLWGSLGLIYVFFKAIYQQLLSVNVKSFFTFPAKKPPAALQKQNGFFICFPSEVS